MKLSEIQDAGIEVFDAELDKVLTFPTTWKKTFKIIEKSLDDFCDDAKKTFILNKIINIIGLLVSYGGTEENIVLETAQLYILINESDAGFENLTQTYSKHIIESVRCLCQKELSQIKEQVFENKNYRYLSKIKVAEYLFELVSNDKSHLFEIDEIIKNYKGRCNKKLMNMLIEARGSLN